MHMGVLGVGGGFVVGTGGAVFRSLAQQGSAVGCTGGGVLKGR